MKEFENLTDIQLMGLCIEREAGGELLEGKIAVGTVIMERVDYRDWDGKTIKEVILKPWQFSWTMSKAGEDYYNEAVDIASNFLNELNRRSSLAVSYAIAMGLIEGKIPRDPDLSKVHCCQYLNPKVAGKTKKKWLASGMKVIKVIGNHEFYV